MNLTDKRKEAAPKNSRSAPASPLGENSVLFDGLDIFSRTENKRNTPDSRKCNYRIYDTAPHCALTAAYPSDDIKAEQADTTPVQSTDDRYYKGDPIHYHHNSTTPFMISKNLVCRKASVNISLLRQISNMQLLYSQFLQPNFKSFVYFTIVCLLFLLRFSAFSFSKKGFLY